MSGVNNTLREAFGVIGDISDNTSPVLTESTNGVSGGGVNNNPEEASTSENGPKPINNNQKPEVLGQQVVSQIIQPQQVLTPTLESIISKRAEESIGRQRLEFEIEEKKAQKIEDKNRRTISNFISNKGIVGDETKRRAEDDYFRFFGDNPNPNPEELNLFENGLKKKYDSENLSTTLIPVGSERSANLSDIEARLIAPGAEHSPIIIDSTRELILDRIAQAQADKFMEGSSDFESFKRDDATGQFLDPRIQEKFTKKLQARIATEVELMKGKINLGTVKKEDLQEMIKDGNTGVNPLLKAEYKKIFKDKFETNTETDQDRKEKVEVKGKEFLDQVLNNVTDGNNFENLLDSLVSSEDINSLPSIVNGTVKKRLESMKEMRNIENKGEDLQKNLLNSEKSLEKTKVTEANLKMWGERFKWILGGMAVLGLGGGFLSGTWVLNSAITGGLIGGAAGFGLSEVFGKRIINQKIELDKAKIALNDFDKNYIKAEDDNAKKLVKSQESAIKLVAAIASSMKDLDLEEVTKVYLKNAGITQALAIL